MEQTPVQIFDLDYKRVSDWLVGKQKLPRDWTKRLQVIQEKIAEELINLSPNLLIGCTEIFPCQQDTEFVVANSTTSSPSSSWEPSDYFNLAPYEDPFDYFRVLWIRNRLSEECTTRTIFGGLTGPAVIWDKIIRAYEKHNVSLGEASVSLSRAAEIELPFLKSLVSRATQQIADIDRRVADLKRSSTASTLAFKQECKHLGIPVPLSGGLEFPSQSPESRTSTALNPATLDSFLRHEIQKLSKKLPDEIQKVVDLTANVNLGKALHYYEAFTEAVHHQARNEEEEGSDEKKILLPCLSKIVRNDLTFWREELAKEKNKVKEKEGKKSGSCQGLKTLKEEGYIKGGGGGGGGEDVHMLNSNMSKPSGDTTAGNVITLAHKGGSGGSGNSSSSNTISDSSNNTVNNNYSTTGGTNAINEDMDPLERVARKGTDDSDLSHDCREDAEIDDLDFGSKTDLDPRVAKLLRDANFRGALVDDLQELRAFLAVRLSDPTPLFLRSRTNRVLAPKCSADSSSSARNGTAVEEEDVLLETDARSLATMLATADSCLRILCGSKIQDLILLATSNRYRQRVQAGLMKKGVQESQHLDTIHALMQRRKQVNSDLTEATRQGKLISKRCRLIKDHLETKMAELFDEQPINIIGDINTLLFN